MATLSLTHPDYGSHPRSKVYEEASNFLKDDDFHHILSVFVSCHFFSDETEQFFANYFFSL